MMGLDLGLAPVDGPEGTSAVECSEILECSTTLECSEILETPSGKKEAVKGEGALPDDLSQNDEPPQEVDRSQNFPSGRIPRRGKGLAARRLDDSPLACLFYAVVLAEEMVLPHFVARQSADKEAMNRRIAFVIGLERAVQLGMIDHYLICWGDGRYPMQAQSIRLFTPGGRRERARVLGELEDHLRQFMNARKRQIDTL